MGFSNWTKKAADCCPSGYEGAYDRCVQCGEPNRWGAERVDYIRTHISKHPLGCEYGFYAAHRHHSELGVGPTRAVALADLQQKAWQREGEARARKALTPQDTVDAGSHIPDPAEAEVNTSPTTVTEFPDGDIIYQGAASVSRGIRDTRPVAEGWSPIRTGRGRCEDVGCWAHKAPPTAVMYYKPDAWPRRWLCDTHVPRKEATPPPSEEDRTRGYALTVIDGYAQLINDEHECCWRSPIEFVAADCDSIRWLVVRAGFPAETVTATRRGGLGWHITDVCKA